jgi:hypothetical protein
MTRGGQIRRCHGRPTRLLFSLTLTLGSARGSLPDVQVCQTPAPLLQFNVNTHTYADASANAVREWAHARI